jgi:Ni/Co efflux regulator RcnB
MKRLLSALASIALLTGLPAAAQPEHQQGQQHENRGGDNRDHREQRGGERRDEHRNDQQRGERRMGERRAGNYGYASPQRYQNNGVHRGWGRDRGNTYQWRRGERMGYNDWYSAPRVDYRRYRLRRPPYGYEWRQYNDRYVLVAISTGLIMSVILNSGR